VGERGYWAIRSATVNHGDWSNADVFNEVPGNRICRSASADLLGNRNIGR
jgi:hypothetical protein